MTKREQMSSLDRSWLLMDRPTNRMVINGLWFLEKPLEYARLVTTLEERLLSFRRFRQRVVEPMGSVGNAYWQDDPHFDIRAHTHRIALPAPGDKATLQDLVADLIVDPLDRSKPLWEFYLIEDYHEGSIVLGRIHHCIADGVALMRVLLSLTDPTAENSWQPPQRTRRNHSRLGRLVRSVAKTARGIQGAAEGLASQGMDLFVNPAHALDLAVQGTELSAKTAAVLAKLALMTADSPTVFKGPLGVTKQVAWSDPIPLDDVKVVKNAMGATVNDVLVAALAGALHRYMVRRGDDPADKEVRAMVPVDVRPLDREIELGNQFALIYLSLPVGIDDPLDRLFEVKRRMDRIKRSPEAVITYQIINSLGIAPGDISEQIRAYFASKASTVLTNVPGPNQKLYFTGTRLDRMIFWVPQSGSIGMGLSILSYGGEVTVGVVTDDNLVPDPDGIADGFQIEFDELLALARQTRETEPDRTAAGSPETRLDRAAADRDADDVSDLLLAQFEDLKQKMPIVDDGPAPASDRCRAVTVAGTRCKNSAQAGSVYCHVHQRSQRTT